MRRTDRRAVNSLPCQTVRPICRIDSWHSLYIRSNIKYSYLEALQSRPRFGRQTKTKDEDSNSQDNERGHY